jgi:hypothetical protein
MAMGAREILSDPVKHPLKSDKIGQNHIESPRFRKNLLGSNSILTDPVEYQIG